MCLLRYHWCEYFSLDELGVFLLKFRPADPGNGIGGATIYVRLTVSTSRSRVLLLLRPAVDATWIPGSVSTLQLPYSVKNNSGLLLAFGQVGARNWDTIGVDESCSYSWDAPGSKAALLKRIHELTHELDAAQQQEQHAVEQALAWELQARANTATLQCITRRAVLVFTAASGCWDLGRCVGGRRWGARGGVVGRGGGRAGPMGLAATHAALDGTSRMSPARSRYRQAGSPSGRAHARAPLPCHRPTCPPARRSRCRPRRRPTPTAVPVP